MDAGKKDGSAGSGGKGGSTGAGGSGSGGSSANGGNSGNGGSGSGGSANGGSSGTGGVSAAGGSSAGGSSGTGGSAAGGSSGTGGTGGTGAVDGGNPSTDGGGDDTPDASIGNNDGPTGSDGGGSVDTGTVTLLDGGAIDQAIDAAEGIDAPVVLLDAEIDTTAAVDLSGVDSGNLIPCSQVQIFLTPEGANGDNTGGFSTTDNFCFATCDTIDGWGGNGLAGRTLLINGQPVPVPDGNSSTAIPTPKFEGTYTVFQVSGTANSTSSSSTIWWWGTRNASCSQPDGGFGLN